MAFRINHNIASMNAWRNLSRNDFALSKSMERLSSGLKINRAGDDPAGLVISENMRAQIAGLGQAIENSELATSMVQTAEGALTEVHSLLNSMRELAVHAANSGANSAEDLAADQAELDNAIASINRLADYTQFGTKKLLDGSAGVSGEVIAGTVEYLDATGDTEAGTYQVDVTTAATQASAATGNSGAISGITADETLTITNSDLGVSVTVTLLAGDDAQTIVDKINEYSDTVFVEASTDGTDITATSTLWGTAGNFNVTSDNYAGDGTQSGFAAGAGDDGTGVDIVGEFVYNGVARQATGSGAILSGRTGTVAEGLQVWYTGALGADVGRVTVENNSLNFQVGANRNQDVSVALDSVSTSSLARGYDVTYGGTNSFANLSEITVGSSAEAADALEIIDAAIGEISSMRSTVGAFQSNTLESGLSSLRIAEENLVAAESVIRDVDMAAEMAQFTRNQIMMQSSIAMLSHANMSPQHVLSLLG